MSVRLLIGDCRERLRELPEQSVNCCVTSPPYFGLRDYGHAGQIGLESTPDAFVGQMVEVFREVRRVLRDDGTLWLNLGDSYASATKGSGGKDTSALAASARGKVTADGAARSMERQAMAPRRFNHDVKDKDLLGIPWRVAFALQADGWYLRQDIIWAKPNPMPESVRDRCTKAHEYVFLLSKGPRYYFDQSAIAEPVAAATVARLGQDVEAQVGSDRVLGKPNGTMKAKPPRFGGSKYGDIGDGGADDETRTKSGNAYEGSEGGKANKRSVWTVATQPFKEAHFATYPPDLIEPCILAGCPKGGTVLDPFGGAGTTGLVADRLQRDAILIELNPTYAEIAQKRLQGDGGMFSEVEAA